MMPAVPSPDTPHSADGGAAFDALLGRLSAAAASVDMEAAWPESQLDDLATSGVLGWVIPQLYGGSTRSAVEIIAGYESLAAACLTTAFILTQRNGACQRIAGAEQDAVKEELLPPLSRGDLFATVGISHLTTSRQHLQPAVHARETDGGFLLNGTIPWVTGAKHADYIVTGGTCDDERQILLALPANRPGIGLIDPVRLLALNASQTGSVSLSEVHVEARYLLNGPVDHVMTRTPGGGAGSGATSALAIGVAGRAIDLLAQEADQRPDLADILEPLREERATLRTDFYAVIAEPQVSVANGHTSASIRRRANSLVLRAGQAYLAAAKGAGFVSGHPAERAVREAMFFLVWSCPQPVVQAALREFACLGD